MAFLIVAFYTEDTPYESEVEAFRKSCGAAGVRSVIYKVPSMGEWVLNCGQKPHIIRRALHEHPHYDVVYVDIDARIRSHPSLFSNIDKPVAVHYKDDKEVLSGTIFFKHSITTDNILVQWIGEQTQNPTVWDQRTLQTVLENHQNSIYRLPASYTQITDTMRHHGEPVIEHFQASRRYKGLVRKLGNHMGIPEMVCGMRTRPVDENTFFLVRASRQQQQELDKQYIRVPNQLRWIVPSNCQRISEYASEFRGKRCYIVGKGPSLDLLLRTDFDSGSVILCLNESVHKVESVIGPNNPDFRVIGIQQDPGLGTTCKPKHSLLFVSAKAFKAYGNAPEVCVYYPEELKLASSSLSVNVAMNIANKFGCTEFVMVAFDACTHGDLAYSKTIPYASDSKGDPSRFLQHKEHIERCAKGNPLSWITPSLPVASSADTPARSGDSQRWLRGHGPASAPTENPDS